MFGTHLRLDLLTQWGFCATWLHVGWELREHCAPIWRQWSDRGDSVGTNQTPGRQDA